MNAGSRIIALSLLAATASDVFSLSITSKPVLIAFAKRAADHPYTYQVTTDAAAGSVTYGLETAPHGMTISPAGRITWEPGQSQAYDQPVSVKARADGAEAIQSFKVFVLGITKAGRDALRLKNQAWVAGYRAATTGTERPNYHMLMYIGDSQSMATNWGSAILGASTWHDGTFPHYPRFWGAYSSSEAVCQEVANGNNGQSAMRSSGHSREYGNLGSQQADFGMTIVRTAVANTCSIGAATATVAFGHNDAAAGKDAATFARQMGAIADSLLAFDIIPILFTAAPGVAGGGWGSAKALALYPAYRDSVVALCARRNLPCIDVYGAVQTALNTGAAPSLASMYNDDVHYKYDGAAATGNPLHNGAFALNLVNHMLAHMLGYLYESGIHAPVLDIHAASFYPQGLPLDPSRSATYLTDYSDVPADLAPAESRIRVGNDGSPSGSEIDFSMAGMKAGTNAKVSIFDVFGRSVKSLSSRPVERGAARLTLVWDGRTEDGRVAPTGLYFAVLEAGRSTLVKRLLRTGRD
jgi:hypothetical protein